MDFVEIFLQVVCPGSEWRPKYKHNKGETEILGWIEVKSELFLENPQTPEKEVALFAELKKMGLTRDIDTQKCVEECDDILSKTHVAVITKIAQRWGCEDMRAVPKLMFVNKKISELFNSLAEN